MRVLGRRDKARLLIQTLELEMALLLLKPEAGKFVMLGPAFHLSVCVCYTISQTSPSIVATFGSNCAPE